MTHSSCFCSVPYPTPKKMWLLMMENVAEQLYRLLFKYQLYWYCMRSAIATGDQQLCGPDIRRYMDLVSIPLQSASFLALFSVVHARKECIRLQLER